MAKIGVFTRTDNPVGFKGQIATLSVQAPDVQIIKNLDEAFPGAPSYKVMVGLAEIGEGWCKESEGDSQILLRIDDPSFSSEIFARLVSVGNGDRFHLIWSRTDINAK